MVEMWCGLDLPAWEARYVLRDARLGYLSGYERALISDKMAELLLALDHSYPGVHVFHLLVPGAVETVRFSTLGVLIAPASPNTPSRTGPQPSAEWCAWKVFSQDFAC
jgi:hypothetical protein